MDLTPYVETLRRELAAAVEAGGDEARDLAERLTVPLESATRLALLDVLSAAMDEITREIAPGSVDVRLRGLEPDFVVVLPRYEDRIEPLGAPASAPAPLPAGADEGGAARVNLRLPARLKARAEEAAGGDGLSVNAWLVGVVSAAVDTDGAATRRTPERAVSAGGSFTGWVR
ncbi:hypothetical protein OG596_19675 [Streptomyces sp. NBC_01102]|uniref:hypothetical protein n=1 Tax=unclassified Streptomyces TaxID=2593676 RepID=UPI00386F9F92|nr:hypothetical protein OG596_19675 [Streptomyces sp. NBC_01102]